jgi:hypothetical protein
MNKIKVHPTQLSQLKSNARFYAYKIVERYRKNTPMISAFKRNDALAVALGYKGHSHLVTESKMLSRSSVAQSRLPLLFKDDEINRRIAHELAAHFANLDADQVYSALFESAPVATKFDVIDGIPVTPHLPVASNVAHEQRAEAEIDRWLNVPFIVDNFGFNGSHTFSLQCLDFDVPERPSIIDMYADLETALEDAKATLNSSSRYRAFDYAGD